MKLGFVTAILAEQSFEEVIDYASAQGFACVEMACWPREKAERRYAGVSHIDVEALTEEKAAYIRAYLSKAEVELSALAFYPNLLSGNQEKDEKNRRHLLKVIDAAGALGVGTVTTFIGRDQTKPLEENLERMMEVWPSILEYAQQAGVRIAIENCPMLFDKNQWPGGQNLMTTPAVWERVFELLPYENLGLNFDPSHFIWQRMDYIRPIYEFREKIFHVHYKDIKLYPDKLERVGVMAYPLEYMAPKIPGLGDVDWGKYVSALTDIGYDGYSCIEIEDRAFEGSLEKIKKSLALSQTYLRNFVI